jgi:hypothetical protein
VSSKPGEVHIGATFQLSTTTSGGFAVSEFSTPSGHYPIFRSVVPIPGVWDGYTSEGEELGTGDGVETVFTTKWSPIVEDSETIYVDGVAQTKNTDYTINYETGEIVFTIAPAEGTAVSVDYSILFIPKDENHVLDVSFTLQFADSNE